MMKKIVTLTLLPLLALAGCGTAPAPDPKPDPAKLELFYASLEAGAEAEPLDDKLAGADRLSGTLAKVEPGRLDPDAVEDLLAK